MQVLRSQSTSKQRDITTILSCDISDVNERVLISGSEDGLLVIWDLQNPKAPKKIAAHEARCPRCTAPDLRGVAPSYFSHAHKPGRCASTQTERPVAGTMLCGQGSIVEMSFNALSTQLVSSGADRFVRTWAVPTVPEIVNAASCAALAAAATAKRQALRCQGYAAGGLVGR